MYDPYGYYKARNQYSLDKDPNVPFYLDFPVNENDWQIGPHYAQLGRLYIPDPALDAQLPNSYDLSRADTTRGPELTSEHPLPPSHGH